MTCACVGVETMEIKERIKQYVEVGENRLREAKEVLDMAKRMNIDVTREEQDLMELEQKLLDIKSAIVEEERKTRRSR